MNTLKNLTAVLTLAAVALLTGCSDSIVTPQNFESSGNKQGQASFDSQSKLTTYSSKLKLKAGESFTITNEEANLETFRNVYVSECNPKEFRISSTTIDSDLGCSWEGYNGFGVDDITIENLSGVNKIIDVNLQGRTRKH